MSTGDTSRSPSPSPASMNGSIGETTWGLNLCWIIMRKNEEAYWVPFPRARRQNRKTPVEAAGAVDAQNAPTAPWKTRSGRFPQLPQALSSGTKVLPLFPANFVTYVPGCTHRPSHPALW